MNPLFDLLCACLKASKHFNKTFFRKITKNLAPFNTTFFFIRLKPIFSSKYFFSCSHFIAGVARMMKEKTNTV